MHTLFGPPISQTLSTTCGFNTDSETDSDALTGAPVVTSNLLKSETSSASSLSTPTPVNATIRNGDDILITWQQVSGATYYNRQVSLNGGGWQNTKTYNHPQDDVTFYDQKARSYRYRLRACNSSGCSSWAETQTVTVAASAPVPATPSSAPGVSGGSYHPVESFVNVSVSSVSHATRYDIFVGTTSSNVSANKSGSGTSHKIWSGGSYGYRYIKYRACNATGCSGLSPWRRIYIYTNPGAANSVAISPTTIDVGDSATLSWTKAGGIISSGYYVIYETRPGQSAQQIASVTAGSGSSYSKGVSPAVGAGSYTYSVKACNPASVGCSALRSASVTVKDTVATPGDFAIRGDL